MKSFKAWVGAFALASAATLMPLSPAQTLEVLTAGSSAQFGPFAVAAYSLATAGGVKAYHYTVKSGSCTSGSTTCYASVSDSRKVNSITIANEPGNLWVVWSTNGIWAYLSVDSTVGVRAFQAQPRATLALAALSSLPLSSTSNYLFWADNTDDTALTTTVYDAINGKAFTAANTDIRPEDALYATTNALVTLKYAIPDSNNLIGYGIQSHFKTTVAHPVAFVVSGKDPFSGDTVSAPITIPIGAAPITFLVNTSSGSGAASATNLKVTENSTNNATALFSGSGGCKGNLLDGVASTVALNPVLREPLSGTMNTTEFTNFQADHGSSQETGISGNNEPPGSDGNLNPLQDPCGSGHRYRAIGTGDEVSGVQGTLNSVGYAFFSYESVDTNANYKYITLDGVDPINASYSTGSLPSCPTSSGHYNCPQTPGKSFPHLRDGTYRSWSMYRIITSSAGQAAAEKLVSQADTDVNLYIPDFVSFSPICRTSPTGADDPGLDVYRQHFIPSGQTGTADDGPQQAAVHCTLGGAHSLPYLTLGGVDPTGENTEAGGDVGGLIEGPFSATHQPTVPGPTGGQDKNQ
jgi:hypothetical protein